MNTSNFRGHGKTLWWSKCERSARITFLQLIDFWSFDIIWLLFIFSAVCFFHVTDDSNVQTSDGWDIYYLSKERALPGTETVESTDTVPRIGGMKISLFIMGANQISDAICLPVERSCVAWSWSGETNTFPAPVLVHLRRLPAPLGSALRRLDLSNDWSLMGTSRCSKSRVSPQRWADLSQRAR